MAEESQERASGSFNFYGPQYSRMDSAVAAEIRREVFGEDIGQESWHSAAEQAEIVGLLGITDNSRVLDVACGAGGPSLALVERSGCRLTGLDIERAALTSNFFFVPPGLNEEAITAAGLTIVRCQDRASAVAEIASRWHAARLRRAELLLKEEGKEWFERRQRMLATTAELARSKRLSRFLYVAEKTS